MRLGFFRRILEKIRFIPAPTLIDLHSVSRRSIFMLGPGGIAAVILIKRYGRLPILFWSQLIGLGFLIGCAVAPDLKTFAAMRILNGFFSTAPQCVGLWTGRSFFRFSIRKTHRRVVLTHQKLTYTVCDMYPFHLQARKLTLWTFGDLLFTLFELTFRVADLSLLQDSSHHPSSRHGYVDISLLVQDRSATCISSESLLSPSSFFL